MSVPPQSNDLIEADVSQAPGNALLRAGAAILIPLAIALIVGVLTGAFSERRTPGMAVPSAAPMFAALGIASWFIGLRFYGLRGMGLRGGRPLFAGIGFAVLAWVALLVARFMPQVPDLSYNESGQAVVEVTLLVEIVRIQSAGAGRQFFYLLLFEAFATQLWAFGTGFRSLAAWRGPLTAAITSGLLFGALGFVFFRESFLSNLSGLIYFLVWGILYGIIRLRTGSILGVVLVQALASFTAWYVFQPPPDMGVTGLATVHLIAVALYALIIWRLWPTLESDYRV